MKPLAYFCCLISLSPVASAETALEKDLAKEDASATQTENPEDAKKRHAQGSLSLSIDQDELSADVQDLIQEQTHPEVISTLQKVEELMAEATDKLEISETGGATIATETEIIELILDAAKKKQQQSGGGKQSDAMMKMMESMTDQEEQQGKGEPKQGDKKGNKGGEGQTGSSSDPNQKITGSSTDGHKERRMSKTSGTTGTSLPKEFQKALNAYNKGLSDKLQNP